MMQSQHVYSNLQKQGLFMRFASRYFAAAEYDLAVIGGGPGGKGSKRN